MYCTNCSEVISELAEICPKCGVRPHVIKNYCYCCGTATTENQAMCTSCGSLLKEKEVTQYNNTYPPFLMGIVSFFIVGCGQMIMGQVAKGIVMFLFCFALGFMTYGLSAFITTPLNILDAVLIAKKKQKGKQVGDWEFF